MRGERKWERESGKERKRWGGRSGGETSASCRTILGFSREVPMKIFLALHHIFTEG